MAGKKTTTNLAMALIGVRTLLRQHGIALGLGREPGYSSASAADSIHIENRGRELLTIVARGAAPADWWRELEKSDPRAIIVVVGSLNRNDQAHYREAARSMVEYKLTERMVATIEKLDRASTRLGRIGVGVGFVGAVATVVGVIVAIVIARGSP